MTTHAAKTLTPPYLVFSTDSTKSEVENEAMAMVFQAPGGGETERMFIAWQPLLMLAAESLAEAFGKRLGENLADRFTQALLGNVDNPSSAFQTEVLARLSAIEAKLDTILRVLEKLPEIVNEATKQAFVEDNKHALSAKGATVSAAIAGLTSKSKTEERLLTEALGVLELGYKLMQYGPPLYVSAVTAMGAALPAFSVLMRRDKSHGQMLGRYAISYLTMLKPLVSEDVTNSFKTSERRLREELSAAQTIVNTLPTGEFLMAATPLFVMGGLPPGVLALEPGLHWYPYFAHLDKEGNGDWTRRGVNKHPEGVPGGWNPATNKVDLPPLDALGWRAMPWWTPASEAYSKDALWGVWGSLHSTVATAIRRSRENPKMIEECNIAIVAIQRLIDCCERLSLLAPDEG